MKSYPPYRTYDEVGRLPSVLSQEYPSPSFDEGEVYYPGNKLLEPHFASAKERQVFGAASFCGFLADTIDVEHSLVIPAVAAVRRLPYEIPEQAEQDLFKTATDEGYHAEQSLKFLHGMRTRFGLSPANEYCIPLFLRRLYAHLEAEGNPEFRNLITVLNGVVTETRISVELGKFAADTSLATSVRAICKSHAEDETIHASQFRALGQWLWSVFDDALRSAAASFITASTIARNLPDVERIVLFFHQATGRSLLDCKELVLSLYTPEVLIDELNVAARPTITLLKQLGVERQLPFSDCLRLEKERLEAELTLMRIQEVQL